MSKKCFGIAGWKNSGKTSLVASLVTEISNRGFVVSTIKHAHHAFDLDTPNTDSFKHREAGANEVVLVSGNRWAIQHELRGNPEPDFETVLEKLSPCDLILVEGYKRENIRKL
ncbi:MAG: molybdopterin-guanine dinucleotide biosynthesis protein B, partial [Pseudomonadota bacterium]